MTSRAIDSSSNFFVAGGTVPPGSPSYVERWADRELYEALIGGEYCYVLNSRQMGKSSLAVRTVSKLQEAGVRTTFVDLTKIGSSSVTEEQWYIGILAELGRGFGLRKDVAVFVRDNASLPPGQRLLTFLQDVVARLGDPAVVMIDEVDAVRSLSFSTDGFFAGLRQLHNGRASDPELKKLTVCLLGAALPMDLIRDPRVTPFNVGRRIELRDFTSDEAAPFGAALGVEGDRKLERVLEWTGGHPFLTQALCADIAGESSLDVDSLVRRRYLDARARETDTNLADVGNRLLGRGDPAVREEDRADVLSQYATMLKKEIPDDESNPAAARIKMSGVARLHDGHLTIRNRIYREVFGSPWIRENMPGQELRRQRNAFWKGALRTGGIAAAVVTIVSALAVIAARNAALATSLERKARWDAYVATMRNMDSLRSQSNLFMINRELVALRSQPARGWEWEFWNRIANRGKRIDLGSLPSGWVYPSPDSRFALTENADSIVVLDLEKGTAVRRIPAIKPYRGSEKWLRDSHRFVWSYLNSLRYADAVTGETIFQGKVPGLESLIGVVHDSSADDKQLLGVSCNQKLALVDLSTRRVKEIPQFSDRTPIGIFPGTFSPDGRQIVGTFAEKRKDSCAIGVLDLNTGRARFFTSPIVGYFALSPDSRTIAVGRSDGTLDLRDFATGHLLDSYDLGAVVKPISFSSDGRRLVAGSRNRRGILFDVSRGKLQPLQNYADTCTIFITGDGRQVVTSYADVRIYRVDDEAEVPEVRLPSSTYIGSILNDGTLFAGTRQRMIHCDLKTPSAQYARVPMHPGWVDRSSGTLLAEGKAGPKLIVANTGRLLANVPSASLEQAFAFSASNDFRRAVIPEKGSSVHLIDLKQPSRSRRLISDEPATASAFSPDGSLVAVAYGDGSVHLYRTSDWSELRVDRGKRFQGVRLAFSSDGSQLAMAGDSDNIQIWDVPSFKLTHELVGHSQSTTALAWSPDGSRVASGSDDNTVRLWDPKTGEELGIIGRHANSIMSVGFLPGGRTLASFSIDGVAKLWKTEERR